MCIPSSIVYHVGGASLSKDNPKKMYLNFRNNLLMLYKNVTQDKLNRTFFFRYIFDTIMNSYKTAVDEKYRFFSFGDAMFIS